MKTLARILTILALFVITYCAIQGGEALKSLF